MMNDPRLHRQVEQHPYRLVFVTISGAHLYGFPSPDSDFDLRGVHILPLTEVVGLKTGHETVEKSGIHDGLETFAAVRKVWPERFPLTVRLSVTDWIEGGVTVDDSVELVRRSKSAGLDLLDVSHGSITRTSRRFRGDRAS